MLAPAAAVLWCALLAFALAWCSAAKADDLGFPILALPSLEVVAVAGQPTLLPCDTLSPKRGETHQMVLVFKDGSPAPIYSWDSRPKAPTSSSNTSCSRCSDESLGHRAYFWDLNHGNNHGDNHEGNHEDNHAEGHHSNTNNNSNNKSNPSAGWQPPSSGLALTPSLLGDAGSYLCRVDFRTSPTRNTFVRLRVLEPLSALTIRGFITSGGSKFQPRAGASRDPVSALTNTTTHPSAFSLTHGSSHDANPSSSASLNSNVLHPIPGLQRGVLNDMPGLTDIITSQDAFGPYKSSLKEGGGSSAWKSSLTGRSAPDTKPRTLGPFPVGEELLLQCEVIHGSPRPTLTLLEGGRPLQPSSITSGGQRSSISYRVPVLRVEHIGRLITCVAENSDVMDIMADTVRLEVAVPPTSLRVFLESNGPTSKITIPITLDSSRTSSFKDTLITAAHQKDNDPTTLGISHSTAEGSLYPYPIDGRSHPNGDNDLQYEENELAHEDKTVLSGEKIQPYSDKHVPHEAEDVDSPTSILEVQEGVLSSVVCESDASRPPGSILWTRDGLPVPDHLIQISHSTASTPSLYRTRSTLRLQPSAALDGAALQCTATAPPLPLLSLHRTVTLSVLYAPHITLTVDSDELLENVLEGSTVSLRCYVHGNPTLQGPITFYKNAEPIHQVAPPVGARRLNVSTEVLMTGPESSGYYSCDGRNEQGSTASNPLHVRVNYAPRCAQSVHSSYSSRGGETLAISCTVHSQPRPHAFRWYMLPADGSAPQLLPNSSHSDHGRSSTLQYRAPATPPYPRLRCVADNTVGSMAKPCVVDIIAAAEPGPVQSCSVRDVRPHIEGAVTITCLPGKDGGLNQSFTLEVRPTTNPQARPPKALYLSSDPEFVVEGLFPSEDYTLTVTATNARGLSPSYTITFTTPAEEVNHPLAAVILPEEMAPLLLVTFGAMAAVMLCSVLALTGRWYYKNQKEKKSNAGKGGTFLVAHTNAEYTRLQRYSHPSIVHVEGEKASLLRLCGVQGGMACGKGIVCGADGSSFCGDSLSRNSCQSTTETLLWTGASDTDSQQTFRNSGCYHIANLTPPECVLLGNTPSPLNICQDRESLEGSNPELQLLGACSSQCSQNSDKISPYRIHALNHRDTAPYPIIPNVIITSTHITEADAFKPVESVNYSTDYIIPVPVANEEISPFQTKPNEDAMDHSQDPNHHQAPCDANWEQQDDPNYANWPLVHGGAEAQGLRPSSCHSSRPSSGLSTVTVAPNPNYNPT